MAIKQKIGKCCDCSPGSPEVALIAGRCQAHYWKRRQAINAQKPKAKARKVQKQVLGTFFAAQLLEIPARCEESGKLLPKSPDWMRRACIAHILPKRPDFGFPSVATHPKNRIFLHPDIHTNMDNFGESYIVKMKSLAIMKARVKELLPHLTEQELNRVPHYFL